MKKSQRLFDNGVQRSGEKNDFNHFDKNQSYVVLERILLSEANFQTLIIPRSV